MPYIMLLSVNENIVSPGLNSVARPEFTSGHKVAGPV